MRSRVADIIKMCPIRAQESGCRMIFIREHIKVDRDQKGQSLLEFPSSYVILDLETTGLDPTWDSIIEFAGVRYVDGHPDAELSTLINPETEIDEYIEELTGITNEMVSSAPTLSEILPEIRDFIGSSTIIAHNANFDINFLYDAYMAIFGAPLSNDFVDTMRLSRRLYPDYSHHRLHDLIARFDVGQVVAHRAMGDVQQTEACYERMHSDFCAGIVQFPERRPHALKLTSKNILPQTSEFDMDSPIYGKMFCFTGTLQFAKRADAMQEVVNRGGVCADSLKKDVDYLVIGGDGYHNQIKNGKSSKWEKAMKLKLSGSPIEVISEDTFLDMLYT